MLLAILPEIGLVVLAAVVLSLDLIWHDQRCRNLGWFTAGGMLLIGAASVLFARPGPEPLLVFGGMLRFDQVGFVFRILFLAGAGMTALLAMDNESLCLHGEFYVMLITSTLGMVLMASATDLILLYLAIETTTIPLFVMVGFQTGNEKSVEAGIKYFLFAAMTSAVMLYGFSLLYGFSGETNLYALAQGLAVGHVSTIAVLGALLLVLVGFAFKISSAPFHFWAPDVYQGAPTPVSGFLSTASKAAGFAVLLRVFTVVFPNLVGAWSLLIAILAVLSMVIGNILALSQKNVKRLLAYSSIAQAGYVLVGVAAGTPLGASGAIYYLMAYLFTNVAAFGLVMIVERNNGSSDLTAFAGLNRRSPALALLMLAAMLSLGGIPPFAGFVAKVLVFAAAVQAGLVWLAVVGVINSLIALYYYLIVLKWVYLYPSEQDNEPVLTSFPWRLALMVSALGIVVLGFVIAPLFNWASLAAALF